MFFEQVKKSIQLNRSWDGQTGKDKPETLSKIRKDFFDGLTKDLMRADMYTLAEVIMEEKNKEKFPQTEADDILGLNIYAAQRKMQAYKAKYLLFFDLDEGPATYELSSAATNILAQTLMNFEADEFKNDRLMLAGRLMNTMQSEQHPYAPEVFHNLCHVYVESQQWSEVAAFLRKQTDPNLCRPLQKTVKMLKQNLVYIFQSATRQEVQAAVDQFEQNFFSMAAVRARKAEEAAQEAKRLEEGTAHENVTEGEAVQDMGHLEKKAMRR